LNFIRDLGWTQIKLVLSVINREGSGTGTLPDVIFHGNRAGLKAVKGSGTPVQEDLCSYIYIETLGITCSVDPSMLHKVPSS
jgi:hypothetical protein